MCVTPFATPRIVLLARRHNPGRRNNGIQTYSYTYVMDRMGYTFVQHHTFLLHNIECICNEGVQSKCARRTSGGMMALSNLNSMQVPCDFLKISTLHNDTLGIIMRTGGKSNSFSRCLFTTSLITTAIIFTSVY